MLTVIKVGDKGITKARDLEGITKAENLESTNTSITKAEDLESTKVKYYSVKKVGNGKEHY